MVLRFHFNQHGSFIDLEIKHWDLAIVDRILKYS
jgi:hypothetical protein